MRDTDKKEKIKKYGIIALAAVGVLLLILSMFASKKEDPEEVQSITYYTEMLEEKLTLLLSQVSGVGDVKVVLTLDGTGEYVYAKDEDVDSGGISYDYVIVKSDEGEEAVMLKEIYPRIRGVAVVCSGGENTKIQKKITELVSAALGINANKIAVSG